MNILNTAVSFFITVMIVLFAYRVYFLFHFSCFDTINGHSIFQIAAVLMNGLANDINVVLITAAGLYLFFAAICSILKMYPDKLQIIHSRIIPIVFIFFLLLITVIFSGDIHYYQYFGGRYNLFFWDFWDDVETARIVVHSIPDEISISRFLLELILFSFSSLIFFFSIKFALKSYLKIPECIVSVPKFKFITLLIITGLLFFPAYNMDKIIAHNRKSHIPESFLLSSAARNSILNIIQSYFDRQRFSSKRSILLKNKTVSGKTFLRASRNISPGSCVFKEKNTWSIKHRIVPAWQKILKRRPKKVILVVMESMPAWPLELEENSFNLTVLPNLSRIKTKGLYFSRYFHQKGGTMRNLQAILYSVGFPEDSVSFSRSAFANNNFPDTLPRIMKRIGYEPVFCYGASYRWQNLYYFLPHTGFSRITGRSPDEMLARDVYGLNDEKLFAEVVNDLRKTEGKTFHLVLTLSNHAPCRIPELFKSRNITIPDSLKKKITNARFFKKRFRMVQYADYAIGRFVDSIKKEPWFKDTLLIFTGDHHFRGVVKSNIRDLVDHRRVPLILYSPHLLIKTNQIISNLSTHYDLMPTIMALVSSEEVSVTTWGKSMFCDSICSSPVVSDFVYDGRFLLTQGRLFDTLKEKMFEGPESKQLKRKLSACKKDFTLSGLHYLYNMKTDSKTTKKSLQTLRILSADKIKSGGLL